MTMELLCLVAGLDKNSVDFFDKVTDVSGTLFRLHMKGAPGCVRYVGYDRILVFLFNKIKELENEQNNSFKKL